MEAETQQVWLREWGDRVPLQTRNHTTHLHRLHQRPASNTAALCILWSG